MMRSFTLKPSCNTQQAHESGGAGEKELPLIINDQENLRRYGHYLIF